MARRDAYESIPVLRRGYSGQKYRIVTYAPSGKTDLWVTDSYGDTNLKMTYEETEELIIRLTYALRMSQEGK